MIHRVVLGVVLLPTVLVGCDEIPLVPAARRSVHATTVRTGECMALVGAIRRGAEGVVAAQGAKASDMRAMAARLDDAALGVERVTLDLPELEGLSVRYRKAVRATAEHARAFAEASEKEDAARMAEERTAATATGLEETKIIGEISRFCGTSGGPPGEAIPGQATSR